VAATEEAWSEEADSDRQLLAARMRACAHLCASSGRTSLIRRYFAVNSPFMSR
jgi:hypothetical protein